MADYSSTVTGSGEQISAAEQARRDAEIEAAWKQLQAANEARGGSVDISTYYNDLVRGAQYDRDDVASRLIGRLEDLDKRYASDEGEHPPDTQSQGPTVYSSSQLAAAQKSLDTGVPLTSGAALTTLGASAGANVAPTTGPIGLAYPADPVNYSTMRTGSQYGYTAGADALTSGIYPDGASALASAAPGAAAAGADNTMVYVLLAAAAVGAYLLLRKK